MTFPPPSRTDGVPAVVLIVDDNVRVLTAVAHLVEAMGYPVMVANGGPEAISVYTREQARIGCVLLDLTMPGMDGIETLAHLSRIDPQVRAVLSSGYSEQSVRARFSGIAPVAFLQKPYLEEDLRQALDQALAPTAA
jgi:CheY-like chemotaxis protein